MSKEIEIQRREFRDYAVAKIQPALQGIVSPGIDAGRLIRVLLACVNRNDRLLECTKQSFVRAIMQAGELGLELGGSLGEAWLIPYKRSYKDDRGVWHTEMEAQFQIGYQGLLTLSRRSPRVLDTCARVVHEGDVFDVDLGPRGRLIHKPCVRTNPGEMVAVYAYTLLDGGVEHIEPPMLVHEVEAIRKRSKQADSGPWVTDYEAMALKTVLRRHLKYVPRSVELSRALEIENENDTGVNDTTAPIIDMAPASKELGSKPARASLREALDRKAAEEIDDVARVSQKPSGPGVPLSQEQMTALLAERARVEADAVEVLQTLKEQRAEIDPEAKPRGASRKAKPSTVDTLPPPANGAAPADSVNQGMKSEARSGPLCFVCEKPITDVTDGVPGNSAAGSGRFRHQACSPIAPIDEVDRYAGGPDDGA
jgi:recombination protein RecT